MLEVLKKKQTMVQPRSGLAEQPDMAYAIFTTAFKVI